ncbi:60S acidic ribosomal protein P0, putative [Talaromyces stipitatus ATCC 10500]|uniref:Ribosome assembly factor mrt4 n=1 Tax=Talaromyces stipitatus (strain ATCC 10500 / CBS 375.48 / QM 6759 / NRRL 1006) TaxID=441959 RepID=B8LYF7_TALSN|nr:mRNA turnover protein MRT4 [Talaromyces stipitatus ATCC 10500]EED22886.1 60S acidic ribosomal protein P0, putative [Talaromyces stipitatus ATCC 10500]
MPVSKRARIVHESKTSKKNHKEQTRRLFANIRECVEQYDHLFVFSVDNMRNTYLKDVRTEFSDGRLFFGKTKVMAVALGNTPETAFAQNLEKLTPFLTGAVGLLFTSRSPEDVITYLESFHPSDFARAGTVSTRSFTIPNGVVYSRAGEIPTSEDDPISHTIEPALRKLGVPTRLVKGQVVLELLDGEKGYAVCREGETLDSRQTTLLKMFGVATSEFRIDLKAQWDRKTGEVRILEKSEGAMDTE